MKTRSPEEMLSDLLLWIASESVSHERNTAESWMALEGKATEISREYSIHIKLSRSEKRKASRMAKARFIVEKIGCGGLSTEKAAKELREVKTTWMRKRLAADMIEAAEFTGGPVKFLTAAAIRKAGLDPVAIGKEATR